MFKVFVRTLVIGMTFLFFILGSQVLLSESANATIQKQQEAPGQMLYQSRHSLRDETGTAWQVILFKRVQNDQINAIHLRLVGFPNQTVFLHPKGLEIMTHQGKLFLAADQFSQNAPAANVGEYNFKEILPQLSSQEEIRLNLPLENQQHTLMLPAPIILEWQQII